MYVDPIVIQPSKIYGSHKCTVRVLECAAQLPSSRVLGPTQISTFNMSITTLELYVSIMSCVDMISTPHNRSIFCGGT